MHKPRFLRPNDFKEMFRPSGPLFAFIAPWAIAMFGQLAALCGIIEPIYSSFYCVVLGNMLTLLAMALVFQILFPQKLRLDRAAFDKIAITSRFKLLVYSLLFFFLALQLFLVLYCKGFPLLWLVTKDPRTYFDYGIKSLNGLLYAVYLFATTCFFLILLKEKSWKNIFLFFVLLLIPILLVTRQVLISVTLQIFCCYLIYNPKKAKKIFLLGCLLLAVFIVIGNYRTGLNELIKILDPKPFYPKFLYPFLWVYAYVVTPFNNINASFDSISPIGLPLYEISDLIPSILRPTLTGDADTGFTLVHKNMTVSSFYLPTLLDYGRLYSFFFMALFQFFLLKSYRKAIKTRTPQDLVKYSVFYMIAVLSIFSNLLLYLPVIFQLAILFMAKIKLKWMRGQKILQYGEI